FHTGFGFLEYANNLLFGKSFLHAASVWGRLYIITVLISGSRSREADRFSSPHTVLRKQLFPVT
ncbi:hypothetical protein, partial [uncultured Herbaspirillum sp.]|uniref:hypothetical protein n=1 Tax=uncultured Herbaspirillum sp. TaxID=160236 RepID=UPI00258EC7B3